jgi:GntR family transcriptional regulator
VEAEPTPGVPAVHDKIADSIRQLIAAGDLSPGNALPTVEELRTHWHCSAGTVRTALAVLRNEGLIAAGRGKASTVRQPPHRITLPQSFGQAQKDAVLRPADQRHVAGAIELTSGVPIAETDASYRYSTAPADDDLAAEFSVVLGTELVRRDYEISDPITGQCLSSSVSYIPREIIEPNPALLDDANEPWPGGHQHQLYTVGIEIDRFIRTVIAVQPTPAVRLRWGIDTGVPVMLVRSRSIDTTGRVVEISDATYPADRTELMFAEQLDRWPQAQRPAPVHGDSPRTGKAA